MLAAAEQIRILRADTDMDNSVPIRPGIVMGNGRSRAFVNALQTRVCAVQPLRQPPACRSRH